MSKYCLVQISDIHANINKTDLMEKFEKMAGAVAVNVAGRCDTVIFLVTGDIADSGKKRDFDFAQEGFDVVNKLLKDKKISSYFYICPGNHDCDFEHEHAEVRKYLVKDSAAKLSREKPNPALLKTFLSIQESFFNFCDNNKSSLNRHSLLTKFTHENLKLQVNVINTAWASEIKESSNLPFVLSELDSLEAKPGFLNISLFHHPKSWIDKHITHEYFKKLHESSDFVFSGHEHNSTSYEAKYANGESQVYFEAGAFHHTSDESKFRIVFIDLVGSSFDVIDFSWDPSSKSYSHVIYEKIVIPKNPQTNSLGLLIDSHFAKFLKDPGISLKHSMKRELELRDFYVFPRILVDADIPGDGGPLKTINESSEFFQHLESKKIHLITGDDKSGKTSFCKNLFEECFSKGLLPIFLEGADFQSPSQIVIKNKIDEKIKKQFKNSSGINLLQSASAKAIAIIDRFDQIPLDIRKVAELTKVLNSLFHKIILTADSSVEIQLIDDPRFGISSDEVSRLQIGPLSTAKRKVLIANWFSIGNSIEVDPNDTRTHQSELYISSLITEYGIPNYPLFILTYLQFAESENALNLKISSNAKLLETLVDLGLGSVLNTKIPYQAKLAYLRELAFKMHVMGKKKFTMVEIEHFHEEYCSRLDVAISYTAIWGELVEAKILMLEADSGCFKYGYFRSYFIAGYLQFNSSSETARETISQLVENIHVSENANIIATLSLFSSQTWILEKLKSKLDGTLKDIKIVGYRDLNNIVKEITKVEKFPLLVSPEGVPSDEEEDPGKNLSQPPSTDLALSISYAIKLIKVLGQLIRNSANAVDGKLKKELIESILTTAAKITSVQASALEHGKDDILAFLFHRLKEKRPTLAEPEIKSEAVRRLMFLVFGSSISLIDVVSRSIGDEYLSPTFKKIEEADTDLKFDLYFLGIKLDWYKGFPKQDMYKIYEETEGKGFMGFLIKYMGFRAMVVRGDIGTQTIQEICAKMELDYKKLGLKALTSTQKPRID